MSQRTKPVAAAERQQAQVFAALGDPTRLHLVGRLSGGMPLSISQLAEGTRLTRQAVTKHLKVLEAAALVGSESHGRETRFRFIPAPVDSASAFLAAVSRDWDAALGRLKALVET